MVHWASAGNIQKSYIQNSKQPTKTYLQILLPSLASAVFAVAITLLLVIPALHREFSAQQSLLVGRLSSIEPVKNTVASAPSSSAIVCGAPNSSVAGANQSTGRAVPGQTTANKPPSGGQGGGNVVEQLLSQNKTDNHALISKTGADSTNQITQVTKNITTEVNTNTISTSANNPQIANSGDVTNSKNTTSGTSTSGSATNTSDVSLMFAISNRAPNAY